MKRPVEDLSKLPKWAQSRIQCLERDLKYEEEKNRRTEAGETEVFVVGPNGRAEDQPLPPGTQIRFILKKDKYGTSDVVVRVQDGRLDINAWRDSIDVYPAASNCLTVGVHER